MFRDIVKISCELGALQTWDLRYQRHRIAVAEWIMISLLWWCIYIQCFAAKIFPEIIDFLSHVSTNLNIGRILGTFSLITQFYWSPRMEALEWQALALLLPRLQSAAIQIPWPYTLRSSAMDQDYAGRYWFLPGMRLCLWFWRWVWWCRTCIEIQELSALFVQEWKLARETQN